MSLVRTASLLAFGLAAPGMVLACGGSDTSYFPSSGGDGTTATPGPDNGNGAFNEGPASTSAACVTSKANAALTPVNLVFMFDRSGSMGDAAEGFDPTVKWLPVSKGMISFFQDSGSAGISASLQFFPADGDLAQTCAAPYGTPDVALTPLATSAPLVSALQATLPNGGTPTLPALDGAITYAKQLAGVRPTDKTAVVLVTDGMPGFGVNGKFVPGCQDNDVSHVATTAQAAQQGSPSIPTYVIGVGPDLTDLNTIASAGGTNQAFMVSVSDPTQTSSTFQQALDSIRAQNISCSFAMPTPPDGEQLNVDAVNVALAGASGSESVLAYDKDCASGDGWHYDDVKAPTQVMLCPSTCTAAQQERAGAITIAFGCLTKGVVR